MPSVTHLLRRARARVLSRRLVASDYAQRTRPRKSPPEDDPAMALPDDMLLEVFKRLPPVKDTIRCAAVCRRWRRVISSGARAGCLPPPPRHFGFFFRSDYDSPLPPFVATTKAGVNLDVRFLPLMVFFRGARIVDGRGGVLVLREGSSSGLGSSKFRKLKLILCNPLERSFRRLPTVDTAGYRRFRAAFVPLQGAGFRVAVVLFGFGDDELWQHYAVLIYDSTSACPGWKKTSASRRRGERHYIPIGVPSVVVGDVAYSLLNGDVMVVDTTEMTMCVLPSPVAYLDWFEGIYWIGKTDDGRPCYFALDRSKLLHVERWALGADSKWTRQQPLPLPREFGEMSSFGKRLRFARFCEGSRMLFFVMDDCLVSFDIQTLEMERLWCYITNDPWRLRRPTGEVYPCNIAWPPVLKDFVH